MTRLLAGLLLLFSLAPLRAEIPEVPTRMEWCGMELTFTRQAREFMAEVIAKLHRSETYFNNLVERATIFMPQVEEAFEKMGVPADLKYIVLQESALIGDAVSTSNAVGFWQFKDFTAREVGLRVDQEVDERKHIYRASIGAAKYFHRLNADFNNWVYAVIGYNQGPTGALPYTDADLFGEREMLIKGNTHWYALKAIAHKIAFQHEINREAPIYLERRIARGGTSLAKLSEMADSSPEELKKYNLWMLKDKLPQGDTYFYFVPRQGIAPADTLVASLPEEVKDQLPEEIREEVVEEVEADLPAASRTVRKPIFLDPDYGVEFVLYTENGALVELSVRHNVNLRKLREWNGVDPYGNPEAGVVLRLKSPKRSRYHIAKAGDTYESLAEYYGKSVAKLHKLNRTYFFGEKLYPGQKVYLKKKKPEGEKLIILTWGTQAEREDPPKPRFEENPTPEEDQVREDEIGEEKKLPEYETELVYHTVQPGETLWRISRMYNTTVAIIQKLNDMEGTEISVGQRLKVLKRTEKE